MAQQTVVTAEPGMEFYDVKISMCETQRQTVGGRVVETGLLDIIQSDGSKVTLIINKNLDISVRYGSFMSYVKKLRIYKKGSSGVAITEAGIVGQTDLLDQDAVPGDGAMGTMRA